MRTRPDRSPAERSRRPRRPHRPLAPIVRFALLASLGLIAAAGPAASPARADTAQIDPTDDAYVEDRYPMTNFGNSGSLYAGDENYNDPIAITRTYLRFDLSALPAGSTVSSAEIRLRTWGIGPSPDIVVNAHDLGTDAWNEGTITWTSAPTGWTPTPSDAQTVNATSTWYAWDVTAGVVAQLAGDGVYSAVLKASVEGTLHNWCGFGSTEQGFGFDPYLEVVYTPGPTIGFAPDQSLLGVFESDASWADLDGDGDFDLAICGESDSGLVTRTYENRSGTLVALQDLVGIDGNGSGALAWGDYDGDGDVDLALAGTSDAGRVARIYENDGSGALTHDAAQALTAVANASLAWGDVDSDGDLDLYLAGYDGANRVAILYENDPLGTLSPDATAGLTGLTGGSADWADWNGDGWLDLVATGHDGTDPRTIFYENSAGSLLPDGNHGIPDVNLSDTAWGDYDLDGDLDLAITGQESASVRIARVYGNDGSGGFTQAAQLLSIYRSSCAWGDWDSDGDLDVAFCGYTGTSLVMRIYENAAGVFVDAGFPLPSNREGSLSWADPDDDGDLDFFFTGADWSTKFADLWEGTGAPANSSPAPPDSLTGAQTVSSVGGAGPLELEWSGAGDAETAAAGLGYELRVGTSPGAHDVVSGTRGGHLPGNAGPATSATLWVPARTYWWSVRTIDAGLRVSDWSAEQVCVPDTTYFLEIHPTEDAYVDNVQVSTPCGLTDPTNLLVGDRYALGSTLRSYLKFNLGGIPADATIVQAELHVFRYGGSAVPYWVDVWEQGIDSWDENTITWNNAPTMFAPVATSTVRVDGAGECIWDVTSDVAAQLVVDGVLTEVLRGGTPPEGSPNVLAEFHADETLVTPQRPFLKVWWIPSAVDAPVVAGAAGDAPFLEQNAPNPFRPHTTIAYTLPEGGPATLAVYDVGGRLVRRLVGGPRTAGRHDVVWDGRDEGGVRVSGGVYFYRLVAGSRTETKRMIRLR